MPVAAFAPAARQTAPPAAICKILRREILIAFLSTATSLNARARVSHHDNSGS
jgi:hypothetical protein